MTALLRRAAPRSLTGRKRSGNSAAFRSQARQTGAGFRSRADARFPECDRRTQKGLALARPDSRGFRSGLAGQGFGGGRSGRALRADGRRIFSGRSEIYARCARGGSLPVLRKDFIVDPWQVWEARATDADSFLLIVAGLKRCVLLRTARAWPRTGNGAARRSTYARGTRSRPGGRGSHFGVNNRDLRTLEVRIETSWTVIEAIPDECVAVCESGLRTHDDLVRLRAAGFDAFLIGEHLMAQPDPAVALRNLLGN